MPLHPEAQAFLDLLSASNTDPVGSMDIEQMRSMAAMPFQNADVIEVARVENRMIPGAESEIPVRIYYPQAQGLHPLLMFFHGGGFVACGLDTHDDLCRDLCNRVGAVVVAVDYRLAPEHKFPAAPKDCYAATCWAVENAEELHADSTRVAVCGDSAGGNMTAVVSLMAREHGGPALVHQMLIYPVTNYGFELPSYEENREGYFLSTEGMKWCWGLYLNDEADGSNPLASPLKAEDLSSLPTATVITAEYDPLRDEAEAYADRLSAAGVEVLKHRYEGMIHGFASLRTMMPESTEAVLTEISDRLRASLTA